MYIHTYIYPLLSHMSLTLSQLWPDSLFPAVIVDAIHATQRGPHVPAHEHPLLGKHPLLLLLLHNFCRRGVVDSAPFPSSPRLVVRMLTQDGGRGDVGVCMVASEGTIGLCHVGLPSCGGGAIRANLHRVSLLVIRRRAESGD